MVQIKIKQKLITVKNKQIQKYKWDRQLLNHKEKINKYQETTQTKLQEIEEETDINQDWHNLKQVILEAAKEFNYLKMQRILTIGGTMNVRQQFKKRTKREGNV